MEQMSQSSTRPGSQWRLDVAPNPDPPRAWSLATMQPSFAAVEKWLTQRPLRRPVRLTLRRDETAERDERGPTVSVYVMRGMARNQPAPPSAPAP